jgi:hypothetical protein
MINGNVVSPLTLSPVGHYAKFNNEGGVLVTWRYINYGKALASGSGKSESRVTVPVFLFFEQRSSITRISRRGASLLYVIVNHTYSQQNAHKARDYSIMMFRFPKLSLTTHFVTQRLS